MKLRADACIVAVKGVRVDACSLVWVPISAMKRQAYEVVANIAQSIARLSLHASEFRSNTK